MKASMIYRNAAKCLSAHRCNFYGLALDYAGQPNPGGNYSPLQDSLDAMFPELYDYCMGNHGDDWCDVQVIALLFMSAIAKDAE